MQKIKILFIDVRGDLGGGSVHLASLLKGLNQDKFELFVAAPSEQFHSNEYERLSKATFQIPYRAFSFLALSRLGKFVEQNKINLIHSHGRGGGIYSRLLGRALKLPVIHTFHGICYEDSQIRHWLAILLEKYFAKFTTRFVHVSDTERNYALQLRVSDEFRSLVIPNGIDADHFHDFDNNRDKLRTKHGLSKHDFVIGCVARFDPCKRHQDLIEAVSQLTQNKPEVKLVLIGKGETEARMRELVDKKGLQKNVLFLGELTNTRPYYRMFDLYVLPSLFEGLPLTPLEALASGCPVVLSDVRGNQDIIEHEKTGLLTPVRNPEELLKSIKRMIEDRALREKLAVSGRRMVFERYTVSKMVASLQNFYELLCPMPKIRRAALVHDWLFHMRGGEKVLESIAELFPASPIFTLFLNRNKISSSLKSHQIFTSVLNRILRVEDFYRFLLPLFPCVIRRFRLKKYDLIISSNHCVAKGVQKGSAALHVCYCHTPMRYVWGFEDEYFGAYPPILRNLVRLFLGWLKKWDLKTNQGVDWFIANSHNVQNRIRQFYQRDSEVIYPPIKLTDRAPNIIVGDYFLVVSALVPYKRIDIAVDAFNRLGLPLVIAGSGPLFKLLSRKAKPNIQMLGWIDSEKLEEYYQSCRALIFPTEEDFGMVPVEAMSRGKPVIAYAKGGALETVVPVDQASKNNIATGILFYEQTADSLCQAVGHFQKCRFDSTAIQSYAQQFGTDHFKKNILLFLNKVITKNV